MNGWPKGPQARTAVRLLLEMLGNGPKRSTDVQQRAAERGVSLRTLKRVKWRVCKPSQRHGKPDEPGGYWTWELKAPLPAEFRPQTRQCSCPTPWPMTDADGWTRCFRCTRELREQRQEERKAA